jgi:tetratricopeptide (TPR) repeat protein
LRRLEGLGDDCRRALVVAAVAGVEFDLPLLERVLDLPAEELVDLLDTAVEGQVLLEEPGVFGRYRFAHPLIRETIYGDVSTTRRGLLHRRLGEAIESLHPDPAEHAGALAYHFHAAGDARKAFEYHCQAADTAERTAAPETALEHMTGAIAAGELLGLSVASDRRMRDLHRRRGWMAAFGATPASERDYRTALEGARAAGDREIEMDALNGLGTHWHVADSARSIAYHEEALGIAEEVGDEARQVQALNRLSLVHANLLDFEQAQALGERALELARRISDEDAAMRAMDSLKLVAHQLGDVERLGELTAELERIQRERNEPWFLAWTLAESSFVPLAGCRWDEAAGRLEEALAISRRMGDVVGRLLTLNARCLLEQARGDYGAALVAGRESLAASESEIWLGWLTWGLALALTDLRAPGDAAAALEPGLAMAEARDMPAQLFCCTGAMARLRWELGDRAGALALLDGGERMIGAMRLPAGHAYLWGARSHWDLARVALLSGDPDRAEALVRAALEPAERAGLRRDVAAGRALLAACEEARGRRAEAVALLEGGLEAAGDDGLPAPRLEAHTALARLTDDAAHAHAARELVDAIAASVGDEELAAGFRSAALAELDTGAAAPS